MRTPASQPAFNIRWAASMKNSVTGLTPAQASRPSKTTAIDLDLTGPHRAPPIRQMADKQPGPDLATSATTITLQVATKAGTFVAPALAATVRAEEVTPMSTARSALRTFIAVYVVATARPPRRAINRGSLHRATPSGAGARRSLSAIRRRTVRASSASVRAHVILARP